MLSAGLNSLICPSRENLRHPYLKKCAHPQGLSEIGLPIGRLIMGLIQH